MGLPPGQATEIPVTVTVGCDVILGGAGSDLDVGITTDLPAESAVHANVGRLFVAAQHEADAAVGERHHQIRVLLARQAGIGAARGAVGRGLEMLVAEPAIAAGGEAMALADDRQV